MATNKTHHHTSQSLAYEASAPQYDLENASKGRSFERKAQIAAQKIVSQFGENCRVLEIGCGTGLFTTSLASRLPRARILATDAFQPMLDIAASRLSSFPNVSLAKYDGTQVVDAMGKFDVICGVDVIHHLESPVDAMRQWRLLAQEHGALLFLETNPLNPILFWRLHNRPEESRLHLNSPPNLRKWCTDAGWRDVSIRSLPFYLPSGPVKLAALLSIVEDVTHAVLVFRKLAGLLLVWAEAS